MKTGRRITKMETLPSDMNLGDLQDSYKGQRHVPTKGHFFSLLLKREQIKYKHKHSGLCPCVVLLMSSYGGCIKLCNLSQPQYPIYPGASGIPSQQDEEQNVVTPKGSGTCSGYAADTVSVPCHSHRAGHLPFCSTQVYLKGSPFCLWDPESSL